MNALLHAVGRLAALSILLSLLVGPGLSASARPEGPIITPTSWSDSFDDSQGLSWLDRARRDDGKVTLSRAQALGQDMLEAISLAEGSDALFYLGGDNAHLWSYDPTTNQSLDLGAPVPAECDT
jgi:hypothetical protein